MDDPGLDEHIFNAQKKKTRNLKLKKYKKQLKHPWNLMKPG